jgi:glycosyltransferase involved in cell wall biosynthesis
LLTRAIRTVKAQMVDDLTVIVVSDDRSAETCLAARALLSGDDIFIDRGGPPGPARSRNTALVLARSDHVLFLDDDDEFSAGYLAAIDSHARAAPGTVLFCDFRVVMDGDDRTAPGDASPVPAQIGCHDPRSVYVRNFIPNSCLVYPLDAIRGRSFDESLLLNEDWDFLLGAIQGRPLRHAPVTGPIIHKTDRSKGDRRGAVNDDLLPEIMLRIYRKWPAPAPDLREARQSLFAAAGITLPAGVL